MSLYQKKVLRQRKANIADTVEDYAYIIEGMKEHGLIDDDFVTKKFKEEKSPSGQVQLLVNVILSSQNPKAYDIFMDLVSKKYKALVTEIQTDIRYEEGVAGVEPEVAKETGVLVHKKFGTSKRFGEGDKRDIIDLLAVKMQLQNEEWQKKIQVTEDKVTELQNVINSREKVVVGMLKAMQQFMKDHQQQLTTHAHGMLSTTQSLMNIIEDKSRENTTKLKEMNDLFLNRVDQILRHRDGLMEERSRCLQALSIKDDRNQLDVALKARLAALNETISKYSDNVNALENIHRIDSQSSNLDKEDLVAELNKRNATIKQLNKRLTDLENGAMEKDELVTKLKNEIEQNKEKISDMEKRIEEVTSELSTLQSNAEENENKKKRQVKKTGVKSSTLKTVRRPTTAVQ